MLDGCLLTCYYWVVNNAYVADLTNDLATAVVKRNTVRFLAQSFMLACAANKVELTEERMSLYMEVYNDATTRVYRLLWSLHKAGIGSRPGKAPVMKFSATVRCDTRCTHATGSECTCTCGGINHGTFFPGMLASAERVAQIKKQNAEELKRLNADPVGRLLHLFGVRNRQEIVRGLALNRAA
jgi:hypothetical protein